MFEITEILKWACEYTAGEYEPGRITFFASIAEWKRDPERVYVAALDLMAVSEMIVLVASVVNGDEDSVGRLKALLEEKLENTNEANLDGSGVDKLSDVVSGILEMRATADQSSTVEVLALRRLRTALENSAKAIGLATRPELQDTRLKREQVREAQASLKSAVGTLTGAQG